MRPVWQMMCISLNWKICKCCCIYSGWAKGIYWFALICKFYPKPFCAMNSYWVRLITWQKNVSSRIRWYEMISCMQRKQWMRDFCSGNFNWCWKSSWNEQRTIPAYWTPLKQCGLGCDSLVLPVWAFIAYIQICNVLSAGLYFTQMENSCRNWWHYLCFITLLFFL